MFEQSFLKQTLWAGIAKGISVIGGVFLLIFIPKYSDVSTYGAFSLLLSYTVLFGILAGTYIATAIKREATQLNIHQTTYTFFNEALKLKIYASIAAALVIVLFAAYFQINVLLENTILFLILLGFMNLSGVVIVTFESLHKLFFEAIFYFVEYTVQIGLILLFYFAGNLTLENILIASIIGYGIAFIIGLQVLKGIFVQFNDGALFALDNVASKEILKRAATLSLSGLALLAVSKLDTIMVSVYVSISDVGFYNIASDIVKNTPLLSMPIILGSIPLFFKSNARVFFAKYASLLTFLNFLLFLVLFFGGEWIISTIYGPGFEKSAAIITILAIYPLVFVVQYFVQEIMILNELIAETLYAGVIVIFVNVILSIVLIPMYGLPGAAYSSVISALVWLCVSLFLARKYIFSDKKKPL